MDAETLQSGEEYAAQLLESVQQMRGQDRDRVKERRAHRALLDHL